MLLSTPHREKQLRTLVQKLGLPESAPVRWELLDLALTHPTASAAANYEQLEFVGDAVVKLAAAEFLFATYPESDEGELSAMRGVLVSDRLLSEISDRYGLDRYLLVSGSTHADHLGRETRLAAALEALLAALYLSTHTLELVHPWLDLHLKQHTERILQDPTLENYKGALQGLTQAHYQMLPDYKITEVGQVYGDPERFVAEVWVQEQMWGRGKGRSKKAAEQTAAQIAFLALQKSLQNESPLN